MDLNTETHAARPASLGAVPDRDAEDAWLAGGPWPFSGPRSPSRRRIAPDDLRWEPILADDRGLAIAATCSIRRLDAFEAPPEWPAAQLIRRCCRPLLTSPGIWSAATVGGHLDLARTAGALVPLAVALEAIFTIRPRGGDECAVPASDLVDGERRRLRKSRHVLRRLLLPAPALRRRAGFRRLSLTEEGRPAALLIGTFGPDDGGWALTVTAAIARPIRIQLDRPPTAGQLRDALREAIPDDLYLDDPHGTPAYRKQLTGHFAEQIRRELAGGGRP